MNSKALMLAVAGMLLVSLTGCEDGFLDLAPRSDANVENFYQTESDINTALAATYATLQYPQRWSGWINLNMYFGDIRSDAGREFASPSQSLVDEFENSTEEDLPTNFWYDAYEAILRANTILERIDEIPMDESLRARYVGETKFLRGLWYFGLVRVFGGVPIVTKPLTQQEAYEAGRASADEVYMQIEKDLKEAIAALPWNYIETAEDDLGRATKGAAHALLGKVYMQWAGYKMNHETEQVEQGNPSLYQDAIEQFEEVINSDEYTFVERYEDLWGIENEFNPEFIFEIMHKGGQIGEGSFMWNDMGPRNSGTWVVPYGEASGRNQPTQWLIDHFKPEDLRGAYTHEYYTRLTDEGAVDTVYNAYSTKFASPLDDNGDSGLNFPLLRYTDILLLYAEALNEVNSGPTPKAYEILNMVRARAGLPPISNNLTKQEFALALEQERLLELAYEHHRWYDLVRTGRAIEVVNEAFEYMGEVYRADECHLLWPIPQRVMDVTPHLQQNPCY